jgi:hypothetical protein
MFGCEKKKKKKPILVIMTCENTKTGNWTGVPGYRFFSTSFKTSWPVTD